jgi:hypothetical protein
MADDPLLFVSVRCKETNKEYAIYGQKPLVLFSEMGDVPPGPEVQHAQFEADTLEDVRELAELFNRLGPGALDEAKRRSN